jgi:hypothetical protein
MTEQLKSAIFAAHGRGDVQEALRLLKSAIEQGDEEAKRVYDRLVEIGRGQGGTSTAIDRSAITHYLCIAPPSAVAEWNRTKRGPVEVAMHPVHSRKIWESQIGIAPDSKDVSVAGFENEGSSNIEPPLASLGLGRDSGHSFFVRSVMIEDPPGTVTRFVLGVAYRSLQFSITNGDVPAAFSSAMISTPPTLKKRFWQVWK